MPVIAAFMVPHPPLIVPAVGKGGEKQIEATARAYEQVAEEIKTSRDRFCVPSEGLSILTQYLEGISI